MTLRRLLAACLAALPLAASAALLPAELFYKDADVKEALLSPSGQRLAVTTAKGTQRVGLVVFDLAPGGRMLRVMQFDDGDVTGVRWVNDERLIFGAIDLSEGSGVFRGVQGLFTVKADGTQFRQLARRYGVPGGSDGPGNGLLSWNHRVVAVPPSKPGELNESVLIAEFQPGERDHESLVWLNTATATTRYVDDREMRGAIGWRADFLGEPRIAYKKGKGRVSAYWRKPGTTAWTQLYESAQFERPFDIEAIDASGNLFISYPFGKQRYDVLGRYDIQRGGPEAKPLVSTPGFDFDGHLVTDERGRTLGIRLTADAETTVWLDTAMKAFQERTDSLFPGHVNRITCRRCGEPDMVALVRSYSDQDPGRLYLYQGKPPEGQKNWRLIKAVREDVKPEQMATRELHRVAARDGLDLPVWITRQPELKGPLPAVVLVHGGPWVRGVRWQWDADAQFLASRGYVVIEPEMRGSTGYGDAHFKAGFKQWGQAMQDDVADALLWAQKQGLASNKACIAGASYGGYSTLMGLVKHPDLYRCGVAWMAVADLDLYVSGSWFVVDDIRDSSRQYSIRELVGDGTQDAAMIAANSPVKQAARIKAPLLLAFGEDDKRVPLEHGKRLREALRAAGNDPIWVTYPHEAHGFTNKDNRLDFVRRMEAFLAKHLAPGK